MKNNDHFLKTNSKIGKDEQLHEIILQEIFRKLLIENNIADDYVLVFEDCFEFKKEDYKGVAGTVNIFKNKNNIWIVWEIDANGENYNISGFNNQIGAYIDAAKRRELNLNVQDFIYNENDTQDIIKSAKDYLEHAINFYEQNNVTKLIQKYLLLEASENKTINGNGSNGKKLVRNK